MPNNIKDSLDKLKTTDIYTMILFALYKMTDIPEYSTLSELVYVLDKDSFFNFLECFGGTTIRVPTKKEFKIVLNALLLYQYVNIEERDMSDALKDIDVREFQLKDVKDTYVKLCSILSSYDFNRSQYVQR